MFNVIFFIFIFLVVSETCICILTKYKSYVVLCAARSRMVLWVCLQADIAVGSVSLLVNCNLPRQSLFVVAIWAVSQARIPDKCGLWGHKAAPRPSLSPTLCYVWTNGQTGRGICTKTQFSFDDFIPPESKLFHEHILLTNCFWQ